MNLIIVDITLSLLEQSFDDEELSRFVSLKATEASQEVRSQLRMDVSKRDATVVYRLPVVRNWAKFPISLKHFKAKLLEAGAVNPDSAQYLLWSEDHRFEVKLLTTEDARFAANSLKLKDIQLHEMVGFLSKQDVLFEHGGNALFALPSSQYSDYFLRVGNLQSNHAFFSAVFFWLLPQLKDVQHIFCDTWSISTTAAVVAESLMTYRSSDPIRSTERVSWSFSPVYLPSSNIKIELIQDALALAEQKGGKVLFLSSFYSSGRLEKEIVDQTLNLDRRELAELVAIYAVGKRRFRYSSNILCNIKKLIKKRGLLGKKVERKLNSEVLSVSKVSFFPDYRSIERRPLIVPDIQKDSAFLDRYVGKRIFSVHRDGRNSVHYVDGSRRHHAFHVDLDALFSDVNFRSILAENLTDLQSFDCILSDQTSGAKSFLRALREVRGDLVDDAEVFVADDWRKLRVNEAALNKVNSPDTRTLVVLPTIITGQTIGDVKRHLRETSAHSLERVHFLVGLLRPGDSETMRNYTELAQKYVGSSSITVVEAVNVPNWGKDVCPWCLEQDRLERAVAETPIQESDRIKFLARQERLHSSTTSGLMGKDVFFNFDGDHRLPFYAKSLFVDVAEDADGELAELAEVSGLGSSLRLREIAQNTSVSEADLCFVAAVALQNWRLRLEKNSVKRYAIDAATVSNDDKFNEARLRAAIWRSLKAEELSLSVGVSQDFRNMCGRIFGSEDEEHHRCLRLEALLAFGPEIGLLNGENSDEWNSSSLRWLAPR